MDIGVTEDSDHEFSGRETSNDNDPSELPKNVDVETIKSPRSSPSKEAQTAKWLRLRKHHNPKYLNLFRDLWDARWAEAASDTLQTSQIGAVNWTADEKGRLFEALAKHGRRNLNLLADAVGTKGELEIQAYLNILQEAELERQQFHRHARNATQAEMPAAVEVGEDVESALEKAADALSAYQEQYDYAVATRVGDSEYIINREVAAALDADADAEEQAAEDAEDQGPPSAQRSHMLFHTSTFCKLSEQLFMKGIGESPTSNWMNLAEAGESPSLTQDALSDFWDLVISFVRRVVQTIIFVTESRLKATSTKYWTPSSAVRLEDVESALDILNLKQSLFEYWLKFPRRRGLDVISGSHSKGVGKGQRLEVNEAEEKLSMPFARGRHSRSSSEIAKSEDSTSTEAHSQVDSAEIMSVDLDESGHSSDQSDLSRVEFDSDSDDDGEDHSDVPSASQTTSAPVSRSKRRRLLLQEQDKYMEELDQQSRQAEEQRLIRELDLKGLDWIKTEVNEYQRPPRKRPKVLRKTAEDVYGWYAPYLAVWETYDLHPHSDLGAPIAGGDATQDAIVAKEQPATATVPATSDDEENKDQHNIPMDDDDDDEAEIHPG